jgi:hypothetical protein
MNSVHSGFDSPFREVTKYEMLPSSFGLAELLPIVMIETFKENEPTLEDWMEMGTFKVALWAITYFAAMTLNVMLLPVTIVADIVAGIAESTFVAMTDSASGSNEILYNKLFLSPVQQILYCAGAILGMAATITYTSQQIGFRVVSYFSGDPLTLEEALKTEEIFCSHFIGHSAISALFEENVLSNSPTANVKDFMGLEYFEQEDNFYGRTQFKGFSFNFDFDDFYSKFNREFGGHNFGSSKGFKFNFEDFNFDFEDFNFEGTQGSNFGVIEEDPILLSDFNKALAAAKKLKFTYQDTDKDQATNKDKETANLARQLCNLSKAEAFMGLQKGYTKEELSKAYRQRAMVFHGDRNPNNKEAADAMFKAISAANILLQDKLAKGLN